VQVAAPGRLDERLMIFRSENNVIMQTQVCGWHMDLMYHGTARALSCFIPDYRWFAPLANIQHPPGLFIRRWRGSL
jgi:hypothetical protein